MNENAQKWVEALESGEYEQGKSKLHGRLDGVDRYCCLGVACKLFIEAGGELRIHEVDNGGPDISVTYNNEMALLPSPVADWLGLTDRGSAFTPVTVSHEGEEGQFDQLTALNDTGASFTEIAKVIRNEPKGLFREG